MRRIFGPGARAHSRGAQARKARRGGLHGFRAGGRTCTSSSNRGRLNVILVAFSRGHNVAWLAIHQYLWLSPRCAHTVTHCVLRAMSSALAWMIFWMDLVRVSKQASFCMG